MFRQKIAQVTNCSCRLITNDKNDTGIFKQISHGSKSINKEAKQKYSLKTQTVSSGKHESKLISAQKSGLKGPKRNQDQRISISGNIDQKRRRANRTKQNSPLKMRPRNFDDALREQSDFLKIQPERNEPSLKKRPLEQSYSRQKSKMTKILKKFKLPDSYTLNKIQSQTLSKEKLEPNNLPLKQISTNINPIILHKQSLQKGQIGNLTKVPIKGKFNQLLAAKRALDFEKETLRLQNYQTVKQNVMSNSNFQCQTKFNFGEQGSSKYQMPSFLNQKVKEKQQFDSSQNFFQNISMISNVPQKTEAKSSKISFYQPKGQFLYSKKNSNQNKQGQSLPTRKRLNTFDQIMGQKGLCESILDSETSQNQNQSSIVIMTLKDYMDEKNGIEQSQIFSKKPSTLFKFQQNNQTEKASILTNESDKFSNFKVPRQTQLHANQKKIY